MPRLIRRSVLAGLVATTLVSSGCAGLVGTGAEIHAVDLDRPEMRQFAVANMTEIERDVRLESGDVEHSKLTPALFWSGIAIGTAGAVGGIVFGTIGYLAKQELKSGYESDGLTVDERDSIVSRGEAYNTAAIALSAVAVIGYALSIVTYGVDWNRCGPLVRNSRKRHCDQVLGTRAK